MGYGWEWCAGLSRSWNRPMNAWAPTIRFQRLSQVDRHGMFSKLYRIRHETWTKMEQRVIMIDIFIYLEVLKSCCSYIWRDIWIMFDELSVPFFSHESTDYPISLFLPQQKLLRLYLHVGWTGGQFPGRATPRLWSCLQSFCSWGDVSLWYRMQLGSMWLQQFEWQILVNLVLSQPRS